MEAVDESATGSVNLFPARVVRRLDHRAATTSYATEDEAEADGPCVGGDAARLLSLVSPNRRSPSPSTTGNTRMQLVDEVVLQQGLNERAAGRGDRGLRQPPARSDPAGARPRRRAAAARVPGRARRRRAPVRRHERQQAAASPPTHGPSASASLPSRTRSSRLDDPVGVRRAGEKVHRAGGAFVHRLH